VNTPDLPFRVETVDHASAVADLRAVREAVFVHEQQVPLALERDAFDPQCQHVLARDLEGAAIGTGRLTPDRRIGRMAVLRAWRGRGVGSALLQALLRLARGNGWNEVELHAQVTAIAFYRSHGFVELGERFAEAGIEHQAMRFRIATAQPVDDRAAAIAVTTALVLGARRRVWICSRELDPGLLDDRGVLEALRGFATRRSGSEVRVLLQDAAAPQRAHAPMLALAQRLPSVFAFREVQDPVDRAYAGAYMATDAGGYYARGLGHRYDGEAELDAPARARQLARTFDSVWERSRPVSEFRALGL
jgi:predicted GNAT family N-acyltransferase